MLGCGLVFGVWSDGAGVLNNDFFKEILWDSFCFNWLMMCWYFLCCFFVVFFVLIIFMRVGIFLWVYLFFCVLLLSLLLFLSFFISRRGEYLSWRIGWSCCGGEVCFVGGGDSDGLGFLVRLEVFKILLSCWFNFLILFCFVLRFGSCRDVCVGLTVFGIFLELDFVLEIIRVVVFLWVFWGVFFGFGFDFDLSMMGVGFIVGVLCFKDLDLEFNSTFKMFVDIFLFGIKFVFVMYILMMLFCLLIWNSCLIIVGIFWLWNLIWIYLLFLILKGFFVVKLRGFSRMSMCATFFLGIENVWMFEYKIFIGLILLLFFMIMCMVSIFWLKLIYLLCICKLIRCKFLVLKDLIEVALFCAALKCWIKVLSDLNICVVFWILNKFLNCDVMCLKMVDVMFCLRRFVLTRWNKISAMCFWALKLSYFKNICLSKLSLEFELLCLFFLMLVFG